jgi:hypothetical protein
MDTTSFPLGPTDPSDQVSTKAGALHLLIGAGTWAKAGAAPQWQTAVAWAPLLRLTDGCARRRVDGQRRKTARQRDELADRDRMRGRDQSA